MSNVVNWLQEWYRARCDGDWEHELGITIATLDNPGWSLKVDLTGTELEGRKFDETRHNRTDDDWVLCRLAADRFEAYCGPANLIEVLERFREWAQQETGSSG